MLIWPRACIGLVGFVQFRENFIDVGMKTVPKEISSRVDHSIRLNPAVIQQQEHQRRHFRTGEPANTPDMVGQNRPVMRSQ